MHDEMRLRTVFVELTKRMQREGLAALFNWIISPGKDKA